METKKVLALAATMVGVSLCSSASAESRARVSFHCSGRTDIQGEFALTQQPSPFNELRRFYFGSAFPTGTDGAGQYPLIVAVGKSSSIRDRGLIRLCIASFGIKDGDPSKLNQTEAFALTSSDSCAVRIPNGETFELRRSFSIPSNENRPEPAFDSCSFQINLP